MSINKRISSVRERLAEARAKRREERHRRRREKPLIEREKQAATASERSRERSRTRSAGTRERSRTRSTGKQPAKLADSSKRPRSVAADLGKLGGGAASVVVELAKLVREMLVIPLALWLAAAEIAGSIVLELWLRAVLPALRTLSRLTVAAFRLGQLHLTPARAVAAVALVAIGALAASQWLDYRAVSVGNDNYSGTVGIVAPPPQVESEIAGSAHAWAMLPLAFVGLIALGLALAGRRTAALALVAVGIVAVAIGLAVDAPKGLDEGAASVAYEGATARLLAGFWIEIATGAVLIACGLMLPGYLRPASAHALSAGQESGPSLLDRLGARARRTRFGRRQRPAGRRPLRGEQKERKVQGART